ncbi:MAG: DUF2232 domain-containing protein [Gemmatimonadota bacterium]|nr:DUF2232 domain-containing protein [Gemmatimonadota bacterium]
MSDPAATVEAAPRKGGWRRLALAIVLFLAVPLIPQLRVMLPIEQTAMLLVAVIASCMIVGWRQGGKASLAVIWLLLAAALIAWPGASTGADASSGARGWAVTGTNGYGALARGWTLILAASFGLVSLFGAGRPFFARALSTLAVAAGLAFVLILVSPGGPTRVAGTMAAEYARRNDESIAQIRLGASTEPWKRRVDSSPAIQRLNDMAEDQLRDIPRWSSLLVPAVLALESLVALALGWSLYHRLNRAPIGPPLGQLRDFRFNDQLVWGVAVGASIYLLPAFAEARNAGLNILVFFGSLYVLRGLGILGWISKGRVGRLVFAMVGAFVLAAILADALGFLISPLFPIAALAFALGLGDTWLDWRAMIQPKTV